MRERVPVAIQVEGISVGVSDHVVQFYDRDVDLVTSVANYILEGDALDEVAIVIATVEHRRALDAELVAAGVDPEQRRRQGGLVALDAATTLGRFTDDGRVNRARFFEVVGGLMREASKGGQKVRGFGEMVALLWDTGDVLGAIRLESLWNELGQEVPFSLYCGYHSASVSEPNAADAVAQLCHLHSSVIHPTIGRSDVTHDPTIKITADFPALIESARAARSFVVEALREREYDASVIDDAALVTSELATNAVRHAGSPFSVILLPAPEVIRIEVRDADPTKPTVRNSELTAESGRGLSLMASIASRWGVTVDAEGKTIWMELCP